MQVLQRINYNLSCVNVFAKYTMKCDVTNQLHICHSLSSSTAEENQPPPPPPPTFCSQITE